MASPDDSFCACYRREARYVAHALRRFGVASDDIDDALQEVFLVLHRHSSEIDPRAPLRPWLHAVARRVSGNRRRSRARRKTEPLGSAEPHAVGTLPVSTAPSPDEQLATKQAFARLQAILDRLPPGRRAVYLMAVLDGLTAAEIAARVRRPRNTVCSQLRIAHEEIRRKLARHFRAAPAPRQERASPGAAASEASANTSSEL